MRRRRATVATSGKWKCKTGGVRRLAVANVPNIFQMLLLVFDIRQASIPKLIGTWQCPFKNIRYQHVATSCANLIKIGPVTPQIKRVTS